MSQENITITIEENHICNCEPNDTSLHISNMQTNGSIPLIPARETGGLNAQWCKTIEHCPLCPGAHRPPDTSNNTTTAMVTPKLVFIIPYRDREQEYKFFSQHMQNILEDIPSNDYKIYFIHQTDKRDFNRGAMKNIGFLVIKKLYPEHYKNINLVFNDIDTMPYSKNFLNYETDFNKIKHFYGFQNSLGGIFSIKAGDFEKISGFPNFWSWGYEDNLLQKRAIDANINIDRSEFYPPFDPNICHIKDTATRIVNRKEFDKYMNDTKEGMHSIYGLEYNIDHYTGFINVTSFFTGSEPKSEFNTIHNLRKGNIPFKPQNSMPFTKKRGQPKLAMFIT